MAASSDGRMAARLSAKVTVSLLAADLGRTLAFYQGLGFRVTGEYDDEDGTWAEVRRDNAVLQFFTNPPAGVPSQPVLSGTIYFYPDDVAALAKEWQGKVAFEWGPEVMPYGMREFGLKDPNGYYLAFTEPAD